METPEAELVHATVCKQQSLSTQQPCLPNLHALEGGTSFQMGGVREGPAIVCSVRFPRENNQLVNFIDWWIYSPQMLRVIHD
jgi:hypothetical protein